MKVPEEFYKGDKEHPVVMTVGELKEQLNKLPDSLPIRHDFRHGIELIVYNYSEQNVHLGFEEVDK